MEVYQYLHLSKLNREGKGNFIKMIRVGTCVQMESILHDQWAKGLDAAEWINPTMVQSFLDVDCTTPLRSSSISCFQEGLLSRQRQVCSHRFSGALSPPAAWMALLASSCLCHCSLRFGEYSCVQTY